MCNCINRIEETIVEKFKESTKDLKNIQITEGPEFKNKGIFFSGPVDVSLYGVIEIKYTHGKANRKWERNMYFTYCPFCGTKMDQSKDEKPAVEQSREVTNE